jgi:hypothetical protein
VFLEPDPLPSRHAWTSRICRQQASANPFRSVFVDCCVVAANLAAEYFLVASRLDRGGSILAKPGSNASG